MTFKLIKLQRIFDRIKDNGLPYGIMVLRKHLIDDVVGRVYYETSGSWVNRQTWVGKITTSDV